MGAWRKKICVQPLGFSPTKDINSAPVKTICRACCSACVTLVLVPLLWFPLLFHTEHKLLASLKTSLKALLLSTLPAWSVCSPFRIKKPAPFMLQVLVTSALLVTVSEKHLCVFFMGSSSVASTELSNYSPSNPSLKLLPVKQQQRFRLDVLRPLLIVLAHNILVGFFLIPLWLNLFSPGLNLNSVWLGLSFSSVILQHQVQMLTLCRAAQHNSSTNNTL